MAVSEIAANKRTLMGTLRRVRTPMLAACCAGLVIGAGWRIWSGRRFRAAIAEVYAQMAAGRFGAAARNLDQLLAWKPDSDEAAYLLGMCEEARRRNKEAAQAWARVGAGSAFTRRAILAQMRLLHKSGQLAASEQLINDAAADPRNEGMDLRLLLVPIYSQIGRSEEAARLIEDRWQHLDETGRATFEESIKLVRLHIELTSKPPDTDSLRAYLDQAGRLAPDDDRIWLGRASLAIQTGAHHEARRWLDACLRRRPQDTAVWRDVLNLGIATKSVAVVQEAARHLSAADTPVGQIHRLAAWLSAQQGDVLTERRELEKLIADAPGDTAALDRLVQLAETEGRSMEADRLSAEKSVMEQRRARYKALYGRTQHVRDAEEMARIADQLGRRFESRVFLTIAIADEPQREDLKRELSQVSKSAAPSNDGRQSLEEATALELHENK